MNPRIRGMLAVLAVLSVSIALPACTAGPDYVRPPTATPVAYKENAGWKTAEPRDLDSRGRWWTIFANAELDALQDEALVANQTLVAAEARFRQARALADSARAGRFPSVGAGVATTRSRSPAASGRSESTGNTVASQHTLSLDANWEPDLWGRVRRSLEAGEAGAAAGAADLEAARLSIGAELAVNYFQLRALDAQIQLFDDTIAAFERTLELTRNRYDAGVAARADVVQAQTQLKTAQAQAIDLRPQRARIEHAIALLVGKAPADFSLPTATLAAEVPALPSGLPSELLERRPDIAAAERRVAAANARIGVAETAYFPALNLSAAAGFQSASLARWFDSPSLFWSVGAALAQTIFDGGLRQAQSEQARATYDESVGTYRQTVLAAFQEVEDNLATLRYLEQEAEVEDEALRFAREAVAIATNQYRAGIVSYVNVVTAQTTALANERTAVDIRNRRLAASVQLLRALGGGWHAAGSSGADARRAAAP